MYSAAFNSFDHLSGSSDPKTGTFSFTQTFGPVQADGQFGPKCNLIMTFSLLATISDKNITGLGKGWSFKLGSYIKSANILTLNTGASLKVLDASEFGPWILSHKLKDIHVEKKESKVYIHHKNGDLEVMDIDPDTHDALLTRFTSANGRYLEFQYEPFLKCNRLVKINDSHHTLATITYDDNQMKTIIVTHPNTPESKTNTLYITPDGLLERIIQSDEEISFKYETFAYDDHQISLYPIKSVFYSNGASEVMEYNEKLHLPTHAPIPYTPGITRHTKITSSDQPHIITTFTYRGNDGEPANNYWGYESGINWEDNTDGLFNYPSYYHYTSTTQCGNKMTRRKYNKFHQNISMIETNGDDSKKIISTNEYYSDETKVLENQPKTYELVKKVTNRYQDSSFFRDLSKSFEYDDWGNVLVETDVHGVRTVSEYYPPEGGDGCPAHPYGMVAYVKQRSHISSDGLLKKTFSYKYKSIPRIGNDVMIVPDNKFYNDSIKTTYSYHDDTNPKTQGLLKSETTTVNGKSTTRTSTYEFPDNNTIHITNTVTGHDGLSTKTSTIHSYWTGLTRQETNIVGVTTKYTHDSSGRLSSLTTGVDTDYELTTTYKYIKNPCDPFTGNPCIGMKKIQETTSGATIHTFYDGENRELAIYQKDVHGILRALSKRTYNEQGKQVSHAHFDYIISESDKTIKKTMLTEATTAYDAWGSKCETGNSDNIFELFIHDPINNHLTKQVVQKDDTGTITRSLSLTKTTMNLFGKPIKVEKFDKNNKLYSTSLFEYDQFGRKTKMTTPNGSVAEITKYDEFDRPVELKHYDGTVVEISYSDLSIHSQPLSITVPSMNVTLGQHEYDSLSRVTSKTVNGVKTHYSYKDGYSKPSRRVNGRGQTLLFDYIPELDMETCRVASFNSNVQIGDWNNTSKESDSVYTFGKKSDSTLGQILSATSSDAKYSYEYSSRFLKTTTQTVGSKIQTVTKEKTTMAEKPLLVKIGDRKIAYEYNEQGDVTSVIDGDIMTEVAMDEFSHVSKIIVKQYNPSSKSFDNLIQTTDTSYDEFSRETIRIIKAEKSKKSLSILTSYDTEDKVTQRTMTINNTDSLNDSYTYDSKRRLVSYEVTRHTSDTLLPQNEIGKPFISQNFTFDGLDNITSIVTKFPNKDIDTASFHYDGTNKQRLIYISHTLITGCNAYPGKITFEYDADGNVTSYNDSVMTYTVSGRLASKNDIVYTYDPFDKLVKSKDKVHVYLDHQHIIQEIDDDITDILCYEELPIGEIRNGCRKIYGIDQSFTTVSVTEDTSTTAITYSPYGHGNNGARIGLNGELRDIEDSSVYHLGNGTRTYFPSFNGFSTADSYSPFHGGGVNPYKYCGGDPINAIDPTGHTHMSGWQIFGFIMSCIIAVGSLIAVPFTAGSSIGLAAGVIGGICGVVSTGLDIAANVAKNDKNDKKSKRLAAWSLSFGLISTIFSLGQIVTDLVSTGYAAFLARKADIDLGEYELEAEDAVGEKASTGYHTRYTVARNPHTIPDDENGFLVGKLKRNGEEFDDNFATDVKYVSERKFMGLYFRKVNKPIRVITNEGRFAGWCNVFSKSHSFKRSIASFTQMSNFAEHSDSISKMSGDHYKNDLAVSVAVFSTGLYATSLTMIYVLPFFL